MKKTSISCLSTALSVLLLAACGSDEGKQVNKEFVKNNPDRRMFNYNLKLLPNQLIAKHESGVTTIKEAQKRTGGSIGYPSWNLLYYSVLCSLNRKDVIIIETGTNLGFSTIILAQALKDSRSDGVVHTVDISRKYIETAKKNVKRAGLSDYVKFYCEDSLAFLKRIAKNNKKLDFVFLDSNHARDHVLSEFEIIYEKVKACHGKVYFDNTSSGGVFEALEIIKKKYGGNFIEYENCAWAPAGNVIWQAD